MKETNLVRPAATSNVKPAKTVSDLLFLKSKKIAKRVKKIAIISTWEFKANSNITRGFQENR
jgi:hypothetical protein